MTTAELILPQSISVDGWKCWDWHVDPAPDANGNVWVWQDIKGWFGGLGVRSAATPRPMLDGDYDGPATFAGRKVDLTGTLISPSRSALQLGMDEIGRVLAATTRRGPMVVDEGQRGLARQSVVRLDGPTLIARTGPYTAEWSMTLYAADPLRYSDELHELVIRRESPATGRAYNLTFPRTYGPAGSGGTGVVLNSGNASTAPLIRFGQSLGNPVLGIVGGDRIALNAVIGGGQYYEIDCQARTVMYFDAVTQPGVNRRYLLTSDSDWLTFPPGYTNLYFTPQTGNGTATVIWRDAWS